MHLHSKKWLKPWGYTTYLAKYAFALKKVAKPMGDTTYLVKYAFALKKVAKTMGVFYVYAI